MLVARLVPNSQVLYVLMFATWLCNRAELIKAQEPEKSEPRNERKANWQAGVCFILFRFAELCIFFSYAAFFSSHHPVYTQRERECAKQSIAKISGERPTLFETVFLCVLRMSFHGHIIIVHTILCSMRMRITKRVAEA